MGKITDFLSRYQQHCLAILRISSAMLFLQHGTTKLLNFPVTRYSDTSLLTLGGAAGAIELVGGLMLAFGIFTRPAAFIMSGTMAVAYFYAHASRDFFPILNGGELAALYSFVFLFITVAGGGKWCLDNLIFVRQERQN